MGDVLSRFPAAEIVWCQEEPQNMGAWTFVAAAPRNGARGHRRRKEAVRYAGRAASASTATGLMSKHTAQREQLIEEALGD